jgi:anti-anti-sigma factor
MVQAPHQEVIVSNNFSFHTSTLQGRIPVAVIHLQGQIDASTNEQFQTSAEKAYQDGARSLLLDLSEVSYISSAGLRALHNIYKLYSGNSSKESSEAIKKGLSDGTYKAPQLKLLNPQENVFKVLKMAGFDMYLDIFHSQKEAISAF